MPVAQVPLTAPTRTARPTAPGEVPGWAGAEVRDAAGAVVGHVAAITFDVQTCAPAQLVVSLAGGGHARLPAAGARCRTDHVVLAA
ncbi:MAG TPA: hypothetical protein VD931_23505 [Baekduia sp.]|nr:hypothetical protein [Baekduia sp.]